MGDSVRAQAFPVRRQIESSKTHWLCEETRHRDREHTDRYAVNFAQEQIEHIVGHEFDGDGGAMLGRYRNFAAWSSSRLLWRVFKCRWLQSRIPRSL